MNSYKLVESLELFFFLDYAFKEGDVICIVLVGLFLLLRRSEGRTAFLNA